MIGAAGLGFGVPLVAAVLALAASGGVAWGLRSHGWSDPGAVFRGRWSVGERLVLLAVAVVLPAIVLLALNSTSGFVWDDLKNLRQAQVEGLSVSHLLEPTSGHFAPGHRLGDWIFQRTFGFQFLPAQVILLLGFALSLVLFHRILSELFRPGLGPLLVTLGYGASSVHVGVTQWWASGLDRIPATILSFAAILAYLRWWRTRQWAYLAVSVLSVALGLLFYIKPVFVPVYLVLMRLLLLEPERPLGETVRETLREWPVWLLYAVVTGTLALVYVSGYPTELNQKASPDVVLRYLGILWSQVLVPNLFGLYVPKAGVSALTWLAAGLTHVAFMAVVGWSVVRSPRAAGQAWVFFGVTFLLNAGIVGATRVGYFAEKIIAYTTYFNLEIVFCFFLALGAAFLRARGGEANGFERPVLLQSTGTKVAATIGLGAYLAVSSWGGYQIALPENWIGARSRMVLDRAEAGLRRVQQSSGGVALVDGVVPDHVVPYLLVPYNSHSDVLPLIDPGVTFDPTGRDLYRVTRRGTVQAVTFEPAPGEGTGVADDRFRATPSFGVANAEARYEDDRVCVETGRARVTFGLKPAAPLEGDEEDLAVAVEFSSTTPSTISLVVDPLPLITEGLAKGRNKFRVVNVAAGDHQHRVFALDAPRLDTMLVVVAPDTEFCLYSLQLGRLVPRA